MKPLYSTVLLLSMASHYALAKAPSVDNQVSTNSGSTISGLINDHVAIGTAYDSQTNRFLNVQPIAGRVDETFGNT